MTKNSDLLDCHREAVRLMHETEFYKPDVNGLSTGWCFFGEEIERNPMAIGSVTVGLNVRSTWVEVKRVMLKSDDPIELAQDIVAEFKEKAEEIRKQTKSSVKQTLEE